MGRYNQIYLKGQAQFEEGVADAAITPGMRVARAADGKYDPVGTAGALGNVLIAIEDALQARTVDTAYAQNDVLFLIEPQPGDELAVLVATGQTLVIGDQLIVNNAGLYIKTTGTPAQTDFICQEAITTSGSQLVKARKI